MFTRKLSDLDEKRLKDCEDGLKSMKSKYETLDKKYVTLQRYQIVEKLVLACIIGVGVAVSKGWL